jgi:hypothetical protein
MIWAVEEIREYVVTPHVTVCAFLDGPIVPLVLLLIGGFMIEEEGSTTPAELLLQDLRLVRLYCSLATRPDDPLPPHLIYQVLYRLAEFIHAATISPTMDLRAFADALHAVCAGELSMLSERLEKEGKGEPGGQSKAEGDAE